MKVVQRENIQHQQVLQVVQIVKQVNIQTLDQLLVLNVQMENINQNQDKEVV